MELRPRRTSRARLAFLALAGAMLVAACGGTTASPAGSGAVASVQPSAAFCSSDSLTATIPTKVNGITLVTTGANALVAYGVAAGPLYNLTAITADLGASPASTCVAGGADQDGQIQIIAYQFQGISSSAIQAEIEKVAKQADPNVTLANTTLGGKAVTTATFPGSQKAPIVAYVKGDTVYIVQSSDIATSTAAVQQLP
jgi:hypothetical protein